MIGERRKQNLDRHCDENRDSILTDSANAMAKSCVLGFALSSHTVRLFTDEPM
jgi:hypothetical protein